MTFQTLLKLKKQTQTEPLLLIGFGCVAKGLLAHLENYALYSIIGIVAKSPMKKRDIIPAPISFDAMESLKNYNGSIVVEAIDDDVAALQIAKETLASGKHLISANKKMLAYALPELKTLAKQHKAKLLYEAAVAGSIPLLQLADNYFQNTAIQGVKGILNGSSNYILTKMQSEGLAYDIALKQAQSQGFAESNPTLDVSGADAKHKLVLIAEKLFHFYIKPNQVPTFGIANINSRDLDFANRNDFSIKQIGQIAFNQNQLSLWVMPQFVRKNSALSTCENEYNAITLSSETIGEQTMIGKGAGSLPTGKAMLEDINQMAKYTNSIEPKVIENRLNQKLKVYLRYPDNQTPLQMQGLKPLEIFESTVLNYLIAEVTLEDLLKNQELLNSPGWQLIAFPS